MLHDNKTAFRLDKGLRNLMYICDGEGLCKEIVLGKKRCIEVVFVQRSE